jgi:tetratricopeptide (TPR) repeat protein
MGIRDLATRLDHALDLLAAEADRADGRHSTLRAALEWSYDLLAPDEQRLFRALSVFPDGFDLATAERIATSVAPSLNPTRAVAQLAEASMLVTSFGPTVRYRMLEVLRAFGLDRLVAHGELEQANTLFREWVEQLVAWISTTAQTEEEPAANERLLAEFDTIRAAWHAARSADDVDRMLSLIRYQYVPAVVRELREVWLWMIDLAQHPGLAGHPRRGLALAAASTGASRTGGDLTAWTHLAERACEVPDSGDPGDRVIVLGALSDARLFEARFDEALAAAVEATQILVPSPAAGPAFLPAAMWAGAGLACAYAGRVDDARAYNANSRDATCPSGRSFHHFAAGEIENAAGSWAEAQRHYEESIRLCERSGAGFIQGVAEVGLVTAQASAGELEKALVGYADLIERWERTWAWVQQWTTLRNLADLLDRLGDPEIAIALRAAADAAADASAAQPVTADETHPDRKPLEAAVSREEVLQTARDAIERHLKALAQLRHE